MRGSHRQFHHPVKGGAVTISGKSGRDVPLSTLASVLEQAGLKSQERSVMRYLVVIEKGPTSYGAHVPDLPGCVAIGETEQEAMQLIREAIEIHLADLRSTGQPIPAPTSIGRSVQVAAA